MEARIARVILPVAGCLLAGTAGAQTIAFQDTVYRLSEVLIEGGRLSEIETLRDRPAFVSILPTEEASRRVTSTAEYLGQSVSFHVTSTGGYGAYSTASIRGSSARQVSVFIDGVPLHAAESGVVDLSDLPTASLSRVEVYRGFGAFDLSGSTIGGVVNLVTQNAEARNQGNLSFSYGSLATQRYNGSYSFARSGWNALAVASALSTDGDFTFEDDNGTPYNLADDEIAKRVNNHLEAREALLKIGHSLGSGTVVLANQFYRKEQGLPGYGSYQSTTEALTKTHDLLHVSWSRPPSPSLPVQLAAGGFTQVQRDLFQDRREKQPPAKPDVFNRSLSYGAHLRWQVQSRAARLLVRGMVESRRETFRSEETFTSTLEGPLQSRTSWVATLEPELRLVSGRLRIIPSGRYERYSDRTAEIPSDSFLYSYLRNLSDDVVTYDQTVGSVSAAVLAGKGITLKGNYGRFYRIPSLMERFGYEGIVLPNPLLEPETGLNWDLGVHWDLSPRPGRFLLLEYVYFRSDVEDLILYYRWGQGTRAVNVGAADIRGHEVSVGLGEWKGLQLSGNLTRLRAVNTGPVSYSLDKQLPDRPELAGFGRLEWRTGPVHTFYEFEYVGGNYWNAYNGIAPNNEDPARVRRLHGAGVTVPVGLRKTEFTLEVRNITDEQVEDVMGYPMPGRSAYGTVSASF